MQFDWIDGQRPKTDGSDFGVYFISLCIVIEPNVYGVCSLSCYDPCTPNYVGRCREDSSCRCGDGFSIVVIK